MPICRLFEKPTSESVVASKPKPCWKKTRVFFHSIENRKKNPSCEAESSIGVASYDYTERTIFGKQSEVLPIHRLNIGIGATQPWGSIGLRVFAAQYLHDLAKHNVGVGGNWEIRIFRGLSFNAFGDVARVKDQLYLSAAGLTSDEVLLQQSERGTAFRYWLNFGLSYRFGSKFANVVNPRMGGGGDMMFFF